MFFYLFLHPTEDFEFHIAFQCEEAARDAKDQLGVPNHFL